MAAAICGVTPNYGLHLDENRKPDVLVKVDADLKYNSDFGALGYHVGKQVKNRIPYFRGIKEANTDQLKALGAAMAASGAVALYHAEGLTPEAGMMDTKKIETINVSTEDIRDTYENLNTGDLPDIVILGCPHASLREIAAVAERVEGKRLSKPLWVCTSRVMKEAADLMSFTGKIESAVRVRG